MEEQPGLVRSLFDKGLTTAGNGGSGYELKLTLPGGTGTLLEIDNGRSLMPYYRMLVEYGNRPRETIRPAGL